MCLGSDDERGVSVLEDIQICSIVLDDVIRWRRRLRLILMMNCLWGLTVLLPLLLLYLLLRHRVLLIDLLLNLVREPLRL